MLIFKLLQNFILISFIFGTLLSNENEQNVFDRKQDLEKSLSQLLQENSTSQSAILKKTLYQQIGNCYFQLEKFPWAALYYYRSLSINPCQPEVITSLNLTLEKLHITQPHPTQVTLLSRLLYQIKQPMTGILFLCGTFIAASLYLWIRSTWMKWLTFSIGGITFMVVMAELLIHYFVPIYGLIVQGSNLYSQPSIESQKILTPILLPGTKVRISKPIGDEWFIIMTPNGTTGYVQEEVIRII